MRDASRPPGRLLLKIDGAEREFLGDDRVFGWANRLENPPFAVVKALSALEIFLRLQIEAGKPLEQKVEIVLQRANSVAFMKVLLDVGRRLPVLFEGPLRELLAIPELYFWDVRYGLGEEREDLRGLAVKLMLQHSSMQSFFEKVCIDWERRMGAEPNARLRRFIEGLVTAFRPQNWTPVDLGGHRAWRNRLAEALRERGDRDLKEEGNPLLTVIPIRCRRYLDDEVPLSDDDIESMWTSIQELASLRESQRSIPNLTPSLIADGICGGIAVLMRFHSDWLGIEPSRSEWCSNLVSDIILNPPALDSLDVPESTCTFSWDCFVAEILPKEWAALPDDVALRSLIAYQIFAPHYSAIEILFRRCAQYRDVLGTHFLQLRRLLFEWAQVAARIQFVDEFTPLLTDTYGLEVLEKFKSAVENWQADRFDAFIDGHLPAFTESWAEMNYSEQFAEVDTIRSTTVWRLHSMTFDLIRHAHTWISSLDLARDRNERREWIAFWREALTHVLQRVQRPSVELEREHTYPYEDEQWVLDGVASTIQHLAPEERPEELWRPVLGLEREAHGWPDALFRSYHRYGLQRDSVPPGYVSSLRAMNEFVFDAVTKDPGSWGEDRDDSWEALLGLDSPSVWGERHRPMVTAMADLFEKWVQLAPTHYGWAAAFCRFLAGPAASQIRLKGLLWLETALIRAGNDEFMDGAVADAMASLLNVIWKRHQDQLRREDSAFAAFRNLLHRLAERQHPLALELQGRIGGLP